MPQFIVVTTRIPTNHNAPVSYVVEAASESDAQKIVKDQLRDFGSYSNYTYSMKPYVPPPAGKILSVIHS